jgi:thioredoxin reductase
VLATDASGSVLAAMHLARMAIHYTDRVTIYTNHNLKLSDDISRHLLYEVTTELQKKVRVDNRRISKLHAIEVRSRKSSKGYAQSHKIVIFFADGKDSKHSFMFHLPTGKLNLDFVQDLHIQLTDGGLIKVDPSSMETTEKGIYAAGDCVSFKRTIIRSMFTGQLAAESIAISRLFDY